MQALFLRRNLGRKLLGAACLVTFSLAGELCALQPPLTPPVATFPVAVTQFVADPARPRVYGTDFTTNHVYVFNTATMSIEATIHVGVGPRGLTLSPDGAKLYVANSGGNKPLRDRSRNAACHALYPAHFRTL